MNNRRAKRDVIVINDEESKREQPPEKIVKEEAESVPSPDVAQLQQQLAKSDEKFKRVCEMAGEYKARIEFLENIIDTKEGIIGNANGAESHDELKNKVAELTKQLEEERRGRIRNQERITQPLQSATMKQPPLDKKHALTAGPINILQSIDSTKPESMSFLGARHTLINHLSKCDMESLLALCKNESFDCNYCGENNLDANQFFVHYLSKEHNEKVTDRPLSRAAILYWKDKLIQAESKVTIHNVCHPTNIFQLCRFGAPFSITIDCAHFLLKQFIRIRGLSQLVVATGPKELYCEVCMVYVNMPGGIEHLFGRRHIQKATAVGADSISRTAVNYWVHLLGQRKETDVIKQARLEKEKEKKPAKQLGSAALKRLAQPDAAAAAASDEAKKKAAKEAAAVAQKHRVQPEPAAAVQKEAQEAANATITAAAVAAANKVAMELRMAVLNRLAQSDPAAATAKNDAK